MFTVYSCKNKNTHSTRAKHTPKQPFIRPTLQTILNPGAVLLGRLDDRERGDLGGIIMKLINLVLCCRDIYSIRNMCRQGDLVRCHALFLLRLELSLCGIVGGKDKLHNRKIPLFSSFKTLTRLGQKKNIYRNNRIYP